MVVVKKKKGESEDRLIARFRKASSVVVTEARDRKFHTTEAEKRKERREKMRHLDELTSRREARNR